ncbi:MAG: FecR family protein [Spirochaetes bacterium]|nr:FecR family protein [Spirochaetota bacterium]
MKFLSSILSNTTDIIAVTVGATIITTFSYLFYADITKKMDIGNAEVVGTISYKKKVAQRKYSSQVVWEDVNQNTPVYNNDSIRTADLSEAVITLNDGTKINIDENSMILLALNKDQINIEFSYGSMLANRDNISGEGAKKLNIKSDKATVSLDKGDIKLDQGKGKDLNVTVNSGNAAITTAAGAEQTIDKNQKVVLAKDTDEITLFKLNLVLLEPQNNAFFFTRKDEIEVKYSWEEVKGEHDVIIEISRDRSFTELEEDKKVTGNSVSLDMELGSYLWRLKAVNKVTKKTEYSDSRKLNVVYDDPVQLISPGDEDVFSYRTTLPIIQFKWGKSETAAAYRLILSKDQSMKNPVKTLEVAEDSVAIDTLKEGSYFWKIEKVLGLKDVPYTSSSKVNQFTVTQKEIVEPPVLVYPPENKQISKTQLEKENVTFTWKKNQQIRDTRLYIARDREFKSLIFSGDSNVNFLKFDGDIATGDYYWRVVGIIDDNETTAPSATRTLRIIKTETISLILPARNDIFVPGEDEKYASVRFSWQRSDIQGKYKLQISDSEEFSDIVKESITDTNTFLFQDIKAGKYFWRVMLLESDQPDQPVLLNSNVQSFIVMEKLEAPNILSPKNGQSVDMADKNVLSLEWDQVKGANLYQVELFKIIDNKVSSVANIQVKTSRVKITDLRKLDIGRFRWTLKALETAESGRKIIREIPVIKNDFEIILGKGIEKIDIQSLEIDAL